VTGEFERSSSSATGLWLVIGLLAAIAGFKLVNDTLDPDCFWHLRVAEQLQREGIGPIVDRLSFASIKTPWTPYSWLAELGMKRLWDLGGYQLAVVVSALLGSAFVMLVALGCAQVAGAQRRFNIVIATALAACLSLPYLSFRPATAAMVLLALCVWLMLRDRRLEERSRGVWLVIPITALLVNVHLVAMIVPLLLGCLLVGAMIENADGAHRVRRYGLLLIASGAACLLTPMLPGVAGAVWDYQFSDVMVASGTIEEMQPIYRTARGAMIVLVSAVLMALAIWNGRRVRGGEWLSFAVGAVLLLRLGRFAPVFAILAAPVLASALPALPDIVLSRRVVQWGAASGMALILMYTVILLPGRHERLDVWLNRNGEGSFGYPCGAAEFVQQNVHPATGRIINEFTWGGYLCWRFSDRYQVFVDGRTQLYSAEFWRSTYLCDDATRAPTLAAVRADAAVLPVGDSVFRAALVELGWTSAYRDQRAEVMLPPNGGSANANQ